MQYDIPNAGYLVTGLISIFLICFYLYWNPKFKKIGRKRWVRDSIIAAFSKEGWDHFKAPIIFFSGLYVAIWQITGNPVWMMG